MANGELGSKDSWLDCGVAASKDWTLDVGR
jgi:hypothetical protein